jgi:hypothetical protein
MHKEQCGVADFSAESVDLLELPSDIKFTLYTYHAAAINKQIFINSYSDSAVT